MRTFFTDPTPRHSSAAGTTGAQARMDRIASPNGDPSRTPDGEAPRRRDRRPGRARDGFRLGAMGWALVQIASVALVLAGVLVWPPADACRDRDRKTGFYAGDSLDKCIRRGIAARIDAADQWIKMTVRRSGS